MCYSLYCASLFANRELALMSAMSGFHIQRLGFDCLYGCQGVLGGALITLKIGSWISPKREDHAMTTIEKIIKFVGKGMLSLYLFRTVDLFIVEKIFGNLRRLDEHILSGIPAMYMQSSWCMQSCLALMEFYFAHFAREYFPKNRKINWVLNAHGLTQIAAQAIELLGSCYVGLRSRRLPPSDYLLISTIGVGLPLGAFLGFKYRERQLICSSPAVPSQSEVKETN